MAKQKNRAVQAPATSSPFEEARDELFQHIMRCGVVEATPEHKDEWFSDTMSYFTDRFPELASDQVRRIAAIARAAAEWDGHKKLRRKSTYSRAALRVPAGSDDGSKRLTAESRQH
jgi:hypothetical protein